MEFIPDFVGDYGCCFRRKISFGIEGEKQTMMRIFIVH
jgi:hypothetical protein